MRFDINSPTTTCMQVVVSTMLCVCLQKCKLILLFKFLSHQNAESHSPRLLAVTIDYNKQMSGLISLYFCDFIETGAASF